MLVRDVIIKNNQFVTQLFLYDLASETLTNLSANENMENILAAWSPDGKTIAVVRRDLTIPRGDQIWLMRADGSDAHVITDAPAVLHGSLNWSPDGKYILYDLYLLNSFPLKSQLEMVNVQTGKTTNLGVIGYNPKWVGEDRCLRKLTEIQFGLRGSSAKADAYYDLLTLRFFSFILIDNDFQ